jgi:pyruvate dehydrogenase E2 component (dihydrolipoamide acetyltransferase)
MPFNLTMPKLSPTMEEGTIVKWYTQEGQFIQSGDLLFEIATDKATVEHQALDEGWLRQILIEEGKTAQINQPIAILSANQNENLEGYDPLAHWKRAPAISQENSKAELDQKEIKKEEQPFLTSNKESLLKPRFVPEEPLTTYQFALPFDKTNQRIFATPLAKKIAQERNLDLTTVQGSGPHGRIMSQDVEKAQPKRIVSFTGRTTPYEIPGSYEEIPLSPIRKVVGNRLQEAKSFIPHFYITMVVDAEPLSLVRDQLKSQQIQISYNDFLVRACALALRKYPAVNCGFNSVNQTIIQFKTIDIAIAVSLEEGLITPIIRHADYKNVGDLSTEIRFLAFQARDGKLTPEQYKGGSFTISNLGMYGVSVFQAIINPPQAAILAVSAVQEVPVVHNGQLVAGKTMHLTLSVDHRVIDGVTAAVFLQEIKKMIETPAILLLN